MEIYSSFLFILGLVIGSFLNVLIDRIPHDESIGGRSHCDYCKKKLRSIDLVPVLSFLRLKGFSSCCGKRLSVFYPLVEILTGLVFVLIGLYGGPSFVINILYAGIASSLIVVFFADLQYRIIPDVMILALIFFATPLLYIQSGGDIPFILGRLLAGVVLFAGMLAVFAATKGKGMGFGDVKFAFTIGYLLGLKMGFIAIYIAFVVGGLVGLALLLYVNSPSKKRSRAAWTLKSKIAFGPFLIAGMVVMLFWGNIILTYVKLLL